MKNWDDYNDRLSEEFILSKFRSVDEIDEELNVYLGRDEYHENMNYMKAGRYNVEIKAKDKSENETTIIFLSLYLDLEMRIIFYPKEL